MTPPDILTQVILMVPLILIYELIIWSPILFHIKVLEDSHNLVNAQKGVNYLSIFSVLFIAFLVFQLIINQSIGPAELLVLIIPIAIIEAVRLLSKLVRKSLV
jgi:hypothetical protein